MESWHYHLMVIVVCICSILYLINRHLVKTWKQKLAYLLPYTQQLKSQLAQQQQLLKTFATQNNMLQSTLNNTKQAILLVSNNGNINFITEPMLNFFALHEHMLQKIYPQVQITLNYNFSDFLSACNIHDLTHNIVQEIKQDNMLLQIKIIPLIQNGSHNNSIIVLNDITKTNHTNTAINTVLLELIQQKIPHPITVSSLDITMQNIGENLNQLIYYIDDMHRKNKQLFAINHTENTNSIQKYEDKFTHIQACSKNIFNKITALDKASNQLKFLAMHSAINADNASNAIAHQEIYDIVLNNLQFIQEIKDLLPKIS